MSCMCGNYCYEGISVVVGNSRISITNVLNQLRKTAGALRALVKGKRLALLLTLITCTLFL